VAIVNVNGVDYGFGQLPFAAWYNDASSVTYQFYSPAGSYTWSLTSGLSQTFQTSTFIVSQAGIVTGVYVAPTPSSPPSSGSSQAITTTTTIASNGQQVLLTGGIVHINNLFGFSPAANVSVDLTVPNPTGQARAVTINYWLTNVSNVTVATGTLSVEEGIPSGTYTLPLTLGVQMFSCIFGCQYTFHAQATSGGIEAIGLQQLFSVGFWEFYEGPVTIYGGLLLVFFILGLVIAVTHGKSHSHNSRKHWQRW
jgi:hypothetical protein